MAESVKDVTTAEWESLVLESAKPVAVDFWHENCIWCRRLDPGYREVAEERSAKMAFYRLHVFQEPAIAERYGVMGTPTVKFFCGGREVHEIVGFRPKPALLAEVDEVVEKATDCLRSSTPVEGG